MKGRLHACENEMAGLKRAQSVGLGAQVQNNNREINAMTLSAESAAQHIRNLSELQSKYMDLQ